MKSIKNILKGLILFLVLILNINTSSAQSCTPFTQPMSVGSRGTEVTRLQSYLFSQGYLPVAPTGYFGNLTHNAVKQYQASKGLDTVGNVGPLTRQALSVDTCSYSSNTNNVSAQNSNLYTNTQATNNNYVVPVSFTSLDEVVTLNIPYGSLLNLPTLQTRTKYPTYTFSGWYSDPTYTTQYNSQLPVSNSFSLYAKWTKICTTGVAVFPNDCPDTNNNTNVNGVQTKQCLYNGTYITIASNLACPTSTTNATNTNPNSQTKTCVVNGVSVPVASNFDCGSLNNSQNNAATPVDNSGTSLYLPVVLDNSIPESSPKHPYTLLSQVISKTLDGYYFDGIYSDFYYKNKFSDTLNSSVLAAIKGSGSYGISDGQTLYVKWSKICPNGSKIFFPETCNPGKIAKIYGEGVPLTIRKVDPSSDRNLAKLPLTSPEGYVFAGYFRDANYTNLLTINNIYYLGVGDVFYIKWTQNCSNGTVVVYPNKCSTSGTTQAPTTNYQTISFKNNGSPRDIIQYTLNSGHQEEVNVVSFTFNDGGSYTYHSIVNQADGQEYSYKTVYYGESLNGVLNVPIVRDWPTGSYVLKAGKIVNGYSGTYVYSDPFNLVAPQDNPDQNYLNFKASNGGSRTIKKSANAAKVLTIYIPQSLKVPAKGRSWIVNKDNENYYMSINPSACNTQGCFLPQVEDLSKKTHIIDGVQLTTSYSNGFAYAIKAQIPISSDMPAGNYVLRICSSEASVYCEQPWYESDVFQVANPVATVNVVGSVLGVSAYQFERELSLGSVGEDVLKLQKVLNTFGFNVEETGHFGEMTKSALKKFQEEKGLHVLLPLGLSEGTGVFGKSTMNYVNNLFINLVD